jgi:plastin-1
MKDSLLLLKIMDAVKPGVVAGKGNVKLLPRNNFDRIANSNYAVELAKGPFGFSLVGISGSDICEGVEKSVLALTWQLMRYHVVSFLSALDGGATDEDIKQWANQAAASASPPPAPLGSLKDPAMGSGIFFLSLLSAIEPRAVDPALINAGATPKEKELNAKYAISCARKLGCTVYLLWEDIVEVKPKMVMVFLAKLMAFAKAREALR